MTPSSINTEDLMGFLPALRGTRSCPIPCRAALDAKSHRDTVWEATFSFCHARNTRVTAGNVSFLQLQCLRVAALGAAQPLLRLMLSRLWQQPGAAKLQLFHGFGFQVKLNNNNK